jgi:hypothetical protein
VSGIKFHLGMGRRHAVTAAFVTVAVFMTSGAVGGTAWAQATLGQTTEIVSTVAGYTDVFLPRRVSLSGRSLENPNLSVEGDALLSGLMLRGEAPRRVGRAPDFPIIVTALRSRPTMRYCGSDCAPDDQLDVGVPGVDLSPSTTYEIPAGRYRLYAITSGGRPVRIRLTLPELTGEATPALTATTEVRAEPIERINKDPFATQLTRFGRTFELRGRGMTYQAWASSRTSAYERAEQCWYARPPEGSDAYGYRCPGSDGSFPHDWLMSVGEGFNGETFSVYGPPEGLPAGSYGLGGNAQAVTLSAEFDAVGASIRFDGRSIASAGNRGSLRLLTRQVRVRRGAVRVAFRCRGDSRCRAGARLLPDGKARRLSIRAGGRKPVSLEIGPSLRRRLAKRHRVTAKLRVSDQTTAKRWSLQIIAAHR